MVCNFCSSIYISYIVFAWVWWLTLQSCLPVACVLPHPCWHAGMHQVCRCIIASGKTVSELVSDFVVYSLCDPPSAHPQAFMFHCVYLLRTVFICSTLYKSLLVTCISSGDSSSMDMLYSSLNPSVSYVLSCFHWCRIGLGSNNCPVHFQSDIVLLPWMSWSLRIVMLFIALHIHTEL